MEDSDLVPVKKNIYSELFFFGSVGVWEEMCFLILTCSLSLVVSRLLKEKLQIIYHSYAGFSTQLATENMRISVE